MPFFKQFSRLTGLALAAALVATPVAAGVLTSSAGAATDSATVDPLAGSLGFGVVVEGDAQLWGHEAETPVLVGGDLDVDGNSTITKTTQAPTTTTTQPTTSTTEPCEPKTSTTHPTTSTTQPTTSTTELEVPVTIPTEPATSTTQPTTSTTVATIPTTQPTTPTTQPTTTAPPATVTVTVAGTTADVAVLSLTTSRELPHTGTSAAAQVTLAGMLLSAGGALILLARRARKA